MLEERSVVGGMCVCKEERRDKGTPVVVVVVAGGWRGSWQQVAMGWLVMRVRLEGGD